MKLLIVDSGKGPDRVVDISAKAITVKSTDSVTQVGLVLVSVPPTGETYVVRGTEVCVSSSRGVSAIRLVVSSLNVFASYVRVASATGSEAAALAALTAEYTPEKLAAIEMTSTVQLAGSAPADFFVAGSQLVQARSVAFGVQDSLIRLDLVSHAGQPGTFWVDPVTWTVKKSEFPRQ